MTNHNCSISMLFWKMIANTMRNSWKSSVVTSLEWDLSMGRRWNKELLLFIIYLLEIFDFLMGVHELLWYTLNLLLLKLDNDQSLMGCVGSLSLHKTCQHVCGKSKDCKMLKSEGMSVIIQFTFYRMNLSLRGGKLSA